MNKILKKLLIAGVVIGIGGSVAFAGMKRAIRAFNGETVAATAQDDLDEVATSSGYYIDGATTIGYGFRNVTGTSAPHVSIGFQTSMNNSSWSATIEASSDTTVTDYTVTDTAITIVPADWIRWILSNEADNATNTTFDLWFRTKDEGGK